jgi:hypothetical protein
MLLVMEERHGIMSTRKSGAEVTSADGHYCSFEIPASSASERSRRLLFRFSAGKRLRSESEFFSERYHCFGHGSFGQQKNTITHISIFGSALVPSVFPVLPNPL